MTDLMRERQAAIAALRARMLDWIASHPTRSPKIVWHYPKNAIVIATILDAMKIGMLVPNQDAVDMMAFMCAGLGDNEEPSLAMLRAAIELEDDDEGGFCI
jgi:hypothetical protein